jgi:small conductance mechanosensitive channel
LPTPASPLQPFIQQPVVASTQLIYHLHHIDWAEFATEWGVRLGGGLLLLVVGMALAKWLGATLTRTLVRFGQERILTQFLGNIVRAIGLIVVFLAALDVIGVPTTSLLTVVGAVGLGMGLALQNSLSNIASGVMLIMLRPFRAGDEVQVASLNGVVDQVRIFQTVLRTFDNRVIILPNSLITTAPITNFTARDRRRIDLTIGIGYDDDIRAARETLIAAANGNAHVLKDPAPDVMVSALAESSVNLVLRAWVATRDYAVTKSELLESALSALCEHGVTIPFPQQDLHVFHHGVADAKQGEKLLDNAARRTAPAKPPRQSTHDEEPAAPSGMPSTPES